MQPVKTPENSFSCFFQPNLLDVLRNIYKYTFSLFLKVSKLKPYLVGLVVCYGQQIKQSKYNHVDGKLLHYHQSLAAELIFRVRQCRRSESVGVFYFLF